MEDVVKSALMRVPEPIQWDEQAEAAAAVAADGSPPGSRVTAH
jgi:ATP-dependent Lon protease